MIVALLLSSSISLNQTSGRSTPWSKEKTHPVALWKGMQLEHHEEEAKSLHLIPVGGMGLHTHAVWLSPFILVATRQEGVVGSEPIIVFPICPVKSFMCSQHFNQNDWLLSPAGPESTQCYTFCLYCSLPWRCLLFDTPKLQSPRVQILPILQAQSQCHLPLYNLPWVRQSGMEEKTQLLVVTYSQQPSNKWG